MKPTAASAAFLFAVTIGTPSGGAETACASLNPAPLVANGVLGARKVTLGMDVWAETERGFGPCSGYSDPDQSCRFNDPGLIRVNVRGKDFYFSSPPQSVVSLEVRHAGDPQCLVVGISPASKISTSPSPRKVIILGYGLVVGLANTGNDFSKSPLAEQLIKAQLARLGLGLVPPSIYAKSMAAVMVTGKISFPHTAGQPIDITVASLGNAESLAGGALLVTSLMAPDGRTYATAQGALRPCADGVATASACIPKGGLITEGDQGTVLSSGN